MKAWCALAAVAALALAPAAARADDAGFTTIFDGTATGSPYSLDQWQHVGAGTFDLQADGTLKTNGGLGMMWYPAKAYGDIVYRVDYMDPAPVDGATNGGVFVRFPDLRVPPASRPTTYTYDWLGMSGPWPAPQTYTTASNSNDRGNRTSCGRTGTANNNNSDGQAWYAIFCGEEIQVLDGTNGDAIKTGSVYNFSNLDAAGSHVADRAKGQWHTMEVRLVGQQYTIAVDGQILTQFDNAIPERSSRAGDPPSTARESGTGYVGIQNHESGLFYRNPRVKELTAPPRNTAAPVVTGTGMTGHGLTCSPGTWSNVDANQSYDIAWFDSNPSPAVPAGTAPTAAQLATTQVGSGASYTPVAADFGKVVWCRVTATNAEGGTAWATEAAPQISIATDATGTVGATTPAQLSLTLGAPANFGPFTPGVANDYFASTTANVISTAGDATLSVSDPSDVATGHLVNGTFSLPQPLQARARNASNTGTAYNAIGSLLNLLTYDAPISNDAVSIDFKQSIGAGDALRTGSYSKTLTFTLSTVNP